MSLRTQMIPLAAFLAAIPASTSSAADFYWGNATGNWSTPGQWLGGNAPGGLSGVDLLHFGGDAGTTAGTAPNYTATNDAAAVPFLLGGLVLEATDTAGLPTDPPLVLEGGALRFPAGSAGISQQGAASFTVNTKLEIEGGFPLSGNGTGVVTLNAAISGMADITKSGTGTFRFGTLPPPPVPPATTSTAPSDNTWMGALNITAGVVRFNNNADSGRTALRSNPVTLSTGASLTCSSQLRCGTLSGNGGTVQSQVTGTNTDTEDIVVNANNAGTYSGNVMLGAPTGTGASAGLYIQRGPGVQTLAGTLSIDKDIGVAGTLVLDGTASLGAQTKGAVIMTGGTLRLENATVNNNNRLRDASATSTGFDPIGGGLVQLSGNAGGTTETAGRVQLCSLTGGGANKPRSGELRFQVIHRAGTAAPTVLTLQSYNRDATVVRALNTVSFSMVDASGTPLAPGATGNNPRIVFTTAPPLSNQLLSSTGGTASVGWATVMAADGLAFASHGTGGISAVATTAFAPATSSASANSLLTGSASVTLGTYAQNSIRLNPASAGLSLTLGGSTTLNTTAIALAGANNYTITGGTLGGSGPRFLQVEKAALTLASGLGNTQSLVKSGAGTLILTNAANATAMLQPVALNAGALRAAAAALPGGEMRFRGGVLEITGGGTFARPFFTGAAPGAPGAGTVNWSGLALDTTVTPNTLNSIAEERGSGGFAAVGADATVDLGPAGVSDLLWEEKGFLQSGYALILGSPSADRILTLRDNLSVSSGENSINYNAREIRVPDNPATTADRARLSGVLSGTIHNDLIKTGAGTLELAAVNTLKGAAIVQAGTLVVSGSLNDAIGVQVLSGATLSGSGSVSTILAENGGRISPGDESLATLTGSRMVWKPGATVRCDLGAAGAADRIALGAGALAKGIGSGAFTFDFGGGGAMEQTYVLATFGSTTFAASDFTAAGLAAGVSGHFAVLGGNTLVFSTVTALPPIETWRQSWFGPGATNSGSAADFADPDGDGLVNLAEYDLGFSPLAFNGAASLLTLPSDQGTLTFTRNTQAEEVATAVEASTTLAAGSWSSIATHPAGGTWSAIPGVTVSETPAGLVTINDGSRQRRFLRITVSR